jgi:aspartate-semialdehyde dehydrogenase
MSINSQSFDIAIISATGIVGEVVRELLEQRQLPINNLHLLASERTAGTRLMFNGKPLLVKLLDEFDFRQVQIAIFVATDQVSAEYAPQAGCTVLDNSQCYINDHEVSLIIPGVNTNALDTINPYRKIVANPDSIVIQLWTVLKPIYDMVPIARINVATYQAVSGQGK